MERLRYIARCPNYAKKDNVEINSVNQYHEWLEEACEIGRSRWIIHPKQPNSGSSVTQKVIKKSFVKAQSCGGRVGR
ncbi:hypothetical protein VP01_1496g7 [Puccinia sorghi]|uniref:Uncharacterized protein n=1 Tax=Puccinia sorghi TaxID=27349 RepID=A0A0L6VJ65_9BASI|nr:hypothetical protein VP01_1496g7 [Puccinia sorghi]